MDFRGGGKSGSARTAGVTLFDRKGGRETLNGVDRGGRQAFQVKSGVGGEAFEVATLALGVNGVKSKGGFPGT